MLIGALGVALAALVVVPAAQASGPIETKCAELETKLAHPGQGEVLRLSEASCEVNLTIDSGNEFTLEGSASGTTLKPKSGHANEPIIKAKEGGAAFTLRHLKFTGTSGASAVEIEDPAEHVTIRENVFVANSAPNRGGAVAIYGYRSTATKPTVITDNVFGVEGAGNSAAISGGAVSIESQAPLEITHNSFKANSTSSPILEASDGGGLAVQAGESETNENPVIITDNTFGGSAPGAANEADYSGGGAFVEVGARQKVEIDGNSFIDNAIAGYEIAKEPRTGAGLSLSVGSRKKGANVLQADNLFAGNTIEATDAPGYEEPARGAGESIFGLSVKSSADRFEGNRIIVDEAAQKYPPEGGGLGVLGRAVEGAEPAAPAAFVGVNDLFIKNALPAGGWGGAIYSGFPRTSCSSECPGTSITLEDSTVVDNSIESGSGGQGSALWGSPSDNLTIENSIVYGNSPAAQIFGFGGTTSFAYSDLCDEPAGTPISGTGLICANPLLNEAGEETAASPTVDAGSNALVPAGVGTDLAGRARITAGRCGDAAVVDMGAFELAEATGCTATTTTSSTTTPAMSTSSTTTTTTTSATTPSVSTPSPPKATSPRAGSGGVELTLTCATGSSAPAGQVCEGEGRLLTIEHLRGRRIASLSRKHRGTRRRIRKRSVVVGSARYKLAAGHELRLKIVLDGAGRTLLRRFHRLPVLVVLTARTATGKVTVLRHHLVLGQSARRGKRSKRRGR
jgi:hypothetical protein